LNTNQAAERRQNLAQHNTNRARFSGRQNVLALAALLLVIFFASCQRNSGGGIGSGTGGFPQPPAEVSSSAQVVKINTLPAAITKGGSVDTTINLTVSPGYHVNANPATYPYLIATEIKSGNVEGITAEQPTYPAAKRQKFEFAEEPLAVYEGAVDIKLPLKASSTGVAGERSLPITIRVQACDTEKCFPPATINTKIPVEVK